MSSTSPVSFDDAYASLIAACDEALVGSQRLDGANDTPLAPAFRSQVIDALDCIRKLRQHWPRPASHDTARPTDLSDFERPETLGRFRIQRELGRGSFGRVYLAFDPQLAREVALKVPRFDVLAAPDLRERFRREAQAAAGLDHPNIVQVFEAGDAGSVCYIAAAYCPGPTLGEWLKKQKEPVPYRLAAEWTASLADAVQHAHSRGVLHRDLKPGNILLSFIREPEAGAGESARLRLRPNEEMTPKITDFGLAKIQSPDEESATQSGAIVGTPQYMAPEQAGGPKEAVREHADLYALGAILYELLTGRPPFQADSVMELLFEVRNSEPVSPRRLRLGVPPDLETICLKCLQKEPEKRYANAGELAADLRRFLNGEPIRARPVGRIEQAVKWAKRKPAIAALASGLAVVILGSILGLTLLYLHAESQRESAEFEKTEADEARAHAESQKKIADRERNDAIEARKRMEQSEGLAKSINRFFLDDVVGAAMPKGIGQGKDVMLRTALDTAVPKIAKSFSDQSVAEAGVSDAVGQAYKSLGEFERARPLLERAVSLREQVLGPSDPDTLDSRLALATVYFCLGRLEESEKLERSILDTARRAHGRSHSITLYAQDHLANTLRIVGKLDESESLGLEAEQLTDAVFGPDHRRTRQARLTVALTTIACGEHEKAESLLRPLWEDCKHRDGMDSAETLVVEGKLGETLQLLNRLDEAEAMLRRNLEARRRVLGDNDPANYTIQGSLALTLKARGKFADAVPLFEGTLKAYQAAIPDNPLIGFWQSHLGDTLTEMEKYNEAEPLLKAGYTTIEKAKAIPQAAHAAERLAKLYRKWGKSDQALEWETKAASLKSQLKRPVRNEHEKH